MIKKQIREINCIRKNINTNNNWASFPMNSRRKDINGIRMKAVWIEECYTIILATNKLSIQKKIE